MRETKRAKRLLPLAQLLPAAAVAAAVLVTLPGSAPVLAEVPERLTMPEPASEVTAEEPAAGEEEILPKLPYADGTYTGSSRGYGGRVKVQVTMADGSITEVQILDASHETASFLRRAKRLTDIVVQEQTWEVDAISEATYTSRGILGAVKNALTGEVVNNPLPPQPKPAEPLVVETFTQPSAYRDGVYIASAQGFGGPITVQVTIADDAITDITILDHAGETSSYYYKARKVVSDILETGSPEVDSVSGATYSSTGILNAVKSALKQAANTEESELPAESEPAEETPEAPAESVPQEEPAVSEVPAAVPEQPEEQGQSIHEWAQELWQSIFPAEKTPASSSESTVVFTAEPAAAPESSAAQEPAAGQEETGE